ncbi:unnamed protein product [Bursaphelenchus okinawaensis]|uniref:Uncharacterized protein n=1 Tax=Bursaphelenchus okinawaensis TaxID=465554 RepID=A0A811KED7_9BILA|nr:unnamed protein product [Bursaphelenchus okinawaensis]CAG9103134.1 unnamed protein product [Bursaphelenchus okinawaensis]
MNEHNRLYGSALDTFCELYQGVSLDNWLKNNNNTKLGTFYKSFLISRRIRRRMLSNLLKVDITLYSGSNIYIQHKDVFIGQIPFDFVINIGFSPFRADHVVVDEETSQVEADLITLFDYRARKLTTYLGVDMKVVKYLLENLRRLQELECPVEVLDSIGDELRIQKVVLVRPNRIGGIYQLMKSRVTELDLTNFDDLTLNELFFHVHEYEPNNYVKKLNIALESDTGVWTIRSLIYNINWMFPSFQELHLQIRDKRLLPEVNKFQFANFFAQRYLDSQFQNKTFDITFDLNFDLSYVFFYEGDGVFIPKNVVILQDPLIKICECLQESEVANVAKVDTYAKTYEITQTNFHNRMKTVYNFSIGLPKRVAGVVGKTEIRIQPVKDVGKAFMFLTTQ